MAVLRDKIDNAEDGSLTVTVDGREHPGHGTLCMRATSTLATAPLHSALPKTSLTFLP